ncbi:hypothetical protein [Aquimarina algiphila]|uniref:Uncharacterized protein n=1 Tax=Aquimarina algiphila TaxID=2047982 RepID=A0A554VA08_9FLAO|nr:hypothetical protein [Aquimarina algiphila]TSE02495.1 hypothetical protein FOF46_30815 [Aquimarina algiphila]
MNLRFLLITFSLELFTEERLIKFGEDNLIQGNTEGWIVDLGSVTEPMPKNFFVEILKKVGNEITEEEFLMFHKIYITSLKEINNWKEIQEKLIKYYELFSLFLDKLDYEFWSRLKDDIQLRKEGFSGMMKMPDEINEYLNEYRSNRKMNEFITELLSPARA